MKPKQRLGQNFLLHRATAERIVKAANLPDKTVILEIGPGTGLLTRALLDAGHSVIAVETDAELIPVLAVQFEREIKSKKLRIIQADIREFPLSKLPKEFHVVANIPYYITGEILRLLLSGTKKPRSVTLLVQKEVAERIVRSKKESLLSLSVKAFGKPTYCFTVPKGAFRPAPKVDSAVLHVANIASPFVSSKQEERFFALLHAGFGHKRKHLVKNLESVLPRAKASALLSSLSLSDSVRAEDVTLSKWLLLSEKA